MLCKSRNLRHFRAGLSKFAYRQNFRFSSSFSEKPLIEASLTFSLGAVVGTLGTFVGMGGSFMALPFLTGTIGLSQHLAHGTSIACAITTSVAGCISYASSSHIIKADNTHVSKKDVGVKEEFSIFKTLGNVDIMAGMCMGSTASLTAIYGARISKKLSAIALKRSLGIFLMVIAPMIPLRDTLRDYTLHRQHDGDASSESQWEEGQAMYTGVKLLSIGLMTGLLSGIFGVGGGAIAVPALCFVTDMPYHTVLGTSLAAMIPTTFSSAATHFLQGTMLIRVAIPLALGSAAGAFMGGMVAKDVSDVWLKYTMAIVLFTLGGNTLRLSFIKKISKRKIRK